jgi:hypothetical protein
MMTRHPSEPAAPSCAQLREEGIDPKVVTKQQAA